MKALLAGLITGVFVWVITLAIGVGIVKYFELSVDGALLTGVVFGIISALAASFSGIHVFEKVDDNF